MAARAGPVTVRDTRNEREEDAMSVAGLILTFLFTFGVLAVVAFALVRLFTRGPEDIHHQHPAVDDGWRAMR
jgi:hypothetical protein